MSGNGGVVLRLKTFVGRVMGNVNVALFGHSVASMVIGALAFVVPSDFVAYLFRETYSHELHEVMRLYGALSVASGWLALQTRRAGDARVKRAMGEAYSISYGLQALALLRAHISSPERHSLGNVLIILILISISAFYGVARFCYGIKVFELPSERIITDL